MRNVHNDFAEWRDLRTTHDAWNMLVIQARDELGDSKLQLGLERNCRPESESVSDTSDELELGVTEEHVEHEPTTPLQFKCFIPLTTELSQATGGRGTDSMQPEVSTNELDDQMPESWPCKAQLPRLTVRLL